ncbi:DNA sulfur modification protein DndE [Natronorubrum bangense]|uniref:DNA sulfur modification protein DndE n=2 Tax=Natronorubrum bangense TaxID=61858 RepID=L9WJT3_9EURY|nr:DNA sulfur modification protein DndE [Natronorubrum bangense]ELY49719.1 DNA sulfur modification protein DndE [Natronorubrum bangense JCM 10635]QCC55351.1 DNA sulfur modification protein DndE [Natronorubrum bangense]7X4E_A Chain A, DNA sulfur modification protein DndE [Natronorubrum bangense JCM 10635]
MSKDLNRVQIDESVSYKLRNLGKATGMTPNYIARIGLTYSLGEDRPPSMEEYDKEGKEFNRYTLLGEHDAMYIALVKKRMLNEGYNPETELEDYFLAHLNRGIETLSGRISNLTDLYDLVPGEIKDREVSATES